MAMVDWPASASNAELVAAGEVRIIIPTSYRGNYLAVLTGATHNAAAPALASVLDFSRHWVAASTGATGTTPYDS